MRFEVFQIATITEVEGPNWRWRLCADNDQVLAHGAAYPNLQACLSAISLVYDADRRTPVVFATTGDVVDH